MFKWWDPVLYWYRNDIESVSVRRGCTFTGFDDSSLNGGSFTIRSGSGADTSVVRGCSQMTSACQLWCLCQPIISFWHAP